MIDIKIPGHAANPLLVRDGLSEGELIMNKTLSSARLRIGQILKVGVFVAVVVGVGVGLAFCAGLFVLGDFSGALKQRVIASASSTHLRTVKFSETSSTEPHTTQPSGDVSPEPDSIPAPLVATPVVADVPEVPVARAIPVLADQLPVRRALPVSVAAAPSFDVRAELADPDAIPRAKPVSAIPRARAVSREELGLAQDEPFQATRKLAQRDALSLNW